MKLTPLVVLTLLSFAASASFDGPVVHTDYVPGLLSVRVAPGGPQSLDEIAAMLSSAQPASILSVEYLFRAPEQLDPVARLHGLGRFVRVAVDAEVDHLALVDGLTRLPGVESVDLNWRLELQWMPDDSMFGEQWAMNNTGQEPGQEPDIDMDAPEAWDITIGDENVVIAILDTGVNYDHEDLADKIWHNPGEVIDGEDNDGNGYVDDVIGWDFVNTTDPECQDPDCLEADNDPMDGHGHGTWMSGIVGAATDNQLGIAGVCPECRVMPCRTFYRDGTLGACDVIRVVAAVYYAVANGADVINMSFASAVSGDSCSCGSAFGAVLDYAHDAGVVVVAAAGNSGQDRHTYPACHPTVIGVASHDADGTRSETSNYGEWVDVAAPGAWCPTTLLGEHEYGMLSGTSIAGSHVAGVAALVLSASSGLTPDEVRQRIMDSSEDQEYWQSVPIAAGRVNACNALSTTGMEEVEVERPGARLLGSYPNPFNPVTTIEYELLHEARVSLTIYDLSGRLVRELVLERRQRAGVHTMPWDGHDDAGRAAASGAYFYRLVADGESSGRKMILLK